jgi:hypothetical protein
MANGPSLWDLRPAVDGRWENAAAESKQISDLVTPRVSAGCWLLAAQGSRRMRLSPSAESRAFTLPRCFARRAARRGARPDSGVR